MRTSLFVAVALFPILASAQYVGIGTAAPNARLDISNNTVGHGLRIQNLASSSSPVSLSLNNSSTSSWQYGIENSVSGTGTGTKRGIDNTVTINSTTTAASYGINSTLNLSSNAASGYGINSTLVLNGNTAAGNYGINSTISGNALAGQALYGVNSVITSNNGYLYTLAGHITASGTAGGTGSYHGITTSSSGWTYGTYNFTQGAGSGWQHGVYNDFISTGSGYKFGVYNRFQSIAAGRNYGVFNAMVSNSNDDCYGSYSDMGGTGSGVKTGTANVISSAASGSGNKFGCFNYIHPNAGGSQYGVYSSVTSGYAGYFLGDVAIGTAAGNMYILPPSRGTNNQVMVTDGSGNVTWQTLSTGWTVSGVNQYSAVTGNVGIGTSSPGVKLEVNSGASHTARFEGSGSMYMSIYESGTYRGYWGSYAGSAEDVDFGTGGGNSTGKVHLTLQGSPALTVAPGSYVGIATTTPAYNLQLGNNSAAKPTSNAWTIASDARLKTNVHAYTEGLEAVLAIRPVWFTYTGEAGMPRDTGVGVLAQDLREVAPYMVGTWTYESPDGSKTEYLDVDNGPMTYMLINAVQEQQRMIEELQAEVRALKARP
jgi:hypothetical protein